MTIRPARASDARVLAQLSGQLGYPTTTELAGARLAELLKRDDHAVLVADSSLGEVIGWVHVLRAFTLESGASAELAGLVVAEGHRSQGTGQALMTAVCAWAEAKGLNRIRVWCNTIRVDAHRFYERLEFTRAKTQVVFTKPLGGPRASS